jgi:pimeloyl-ACP methyl ester carboxylesterase
VTGAIVLGVVLPTSLMWARVHPPRAPLDDDPGRHGLRYEEVAFPSPLDGTVLRGWYLPSATPTGRVVIVVAGIDANRLAGGITLRLAPALLADGFDVLAFDLRAQGESGGDTLSFGAREQHDVLGAVAFARSRGARHVAVLGFSMGAASTLLAAARTTDIEALVLDSVFADWESTFRGELRSAWHLAGPFVDYAVLLYRLLSGTDPASVKPAEAIAAVPPRPILLIAGAADDVVDPADGAAMATAAGPAAEYLLVPGAGHTRAYFVDPVTYTTRVRALLGRLPVEP